MSPPKSDAPPTNFPAQSSGRCSTQPATPQSNTRSPQECKATFRPLPPNRPASSQPIPVLNTSSPTRDSTPLPEPPASRTTPPPDYSSKSHNGTAASPMARLTPTCNPTPDK